MRENENYDGIKDMITEEMSMKETFYLFIFDDGSTYEMNCAISFKDAVREMAKYTGNSTDMFFKCLNGYESDDINGIIDLFNHFCYYYLISKVYVVERKVFDVSERRDTE